MTRKVNKMKRILIAIAAVAFLTVPALAATTTGPATISITIPPYAQIEMNSNIPVSSGAADYSGATSGTNATLATVSTNCPWTSSVAIACPQTTGSMPAVTANLVSCIVADGLIDTMPVVSVVLTPSSSTAAAGTGTAGQSISATAIVTRAGLNDAAGTYAGNVTITITY